jgi:hypothetical protein
MLLRRFFIASLAPCLALGLSLAGSYRQTHSNMYVQYTTEIDWKCVMVYATANDEDDPTTLDLYKQARLHGGPVTITTPVQKVEVGPSNLTVAQPLKQTYGIHWLNNDTVVITGQETPSLYVWQRSNSSGEPVDIPRLTAYLTTIPFDVPDATYRQIRVTYDVENCAGGGGPPE